MLIELWQYMLWFVMAKTLGRMQIIYVPFTSDRPLAESYSPLDSNFCSQTASPESLRDHGLLHSSLSSNPLSVFPMSESGVRN